MHSTKKAPLPSQSRNNDDDMRLTTHSHPLADESFEPFYRVYVCLCACVFQTQSQRLHTHTLTQIQLKKESVSMRFEGIEI